MLRRILSVTGYLLLICTGVQASDLRMTGRVECRMGDETVDLTFPCPGRSQLVFRSEDGRRFFLSDKDPRKAIFEDGRIRNELLRITARQDEEGAPGSVTGAYCEEWANISSPLFLPGLQYYCLRPRALLVLPGRVRVPREGDRRTVKVDEGCPGSAGSPSTRCKVRSSAIWCGSVQVENNLARSAGSSSRFGSLSWEGHRFVLHLRRAKR